MKTIFIIFGSLFLVFFQLTYVSRFDFFGIAPNLILGAAIAWVLCQRDQKSNWGIILPVFIFDLMIGRPFGVMTLALWLTCTLVIWLSQFLFKQSGFFSILVLALLGVFSFEVSYMGLTELAEFFKISTEKIYLSGFFFFRNLFFVLAVNAAFCFLFLFLFRKFSKYFFPSVQLINKIK